MTKVIKRVIGDESWSNIGKLVINVELRSEFLGFQRVYKVSTDTMLDNIEDEIFALEEFRKQNLSPENDDHSSFTYLDGIDHAISLLEDRRKTTLGITVPRDD